MITPDRYTGTDAHARRRALLDRLAAMAGDLVDPISDTDRLAWQRRAVDLLAELLAEATRLRLPPLGWLIHPGLALIGTCQVDPVKGRAAFEAWCAFLDADPAPEVHGEFGDLTHLRATVGSALNTSVTVAIEADLLPDYTHATETTPTTTRTTTSAKRKEDR